jgi:chromosome partitioning protein
VPKARSAFDLQLNLVSSILVEMIISFANLKGGTGKTTTVVNLATALSMDGHRVLIIDLVPQGDATFSLGVQRAEAGYNLSDVLFRGRKMESAILETPAARLCVLPSSMDLINADLELAPRKGRETTLSTSITSYIRRDFDYIFLDCPSVVNLLLVNALVSSDFLFVPTTPAYLSVRGLEEILRVQEELKRNMNCSIKFLGILLNMVDYRLSVTESIIGELRSNYGKKVLNTTVERTSVLMECVTSHASILQMRPGSPAARSFLRLRDEFVSRIDKECAEREIASDKSTIELLKKPDPIA